VFSQKIVSLALMFTVAASHSTSVLPNDENPTPLAKGARNEGQQSAISGAGEFQRYCALCHGLDGQGVGPLTDVNRFKTKPADLTQITERNGGAFPFDKVANAIRSGGGIAGHESALMQPWGKLFAADSDPARAEAFVHEMTKYVQSLQQK
jgi:mono/diheme cytochrome c family protein